MFNSYRHYELDFDPLDSLLESDRPIYIARKAVCEARFRWSDDLRQVFNNCLLHMSTSVPGKIAYFQDVEALRQNRVTRTSPQMFLDRYLINAPDRIRASFSIELLGKTLPDVKFIENTDPEGWIRVYKNGPNSCMKGTDIVDCYAHPKNNLALAYNEREDGTIQNRAIVNRENKTYVRIFGVEGPEFAAALRKLGYTNDPDLALQGETIYVKETTCRDCENGIFVGPYLDCSDQYVANIRFDGFSDKHVGIISSSGESLVHQGDRHEGFTCCE